MTKRMTCVFDCDVRSLLGNPHQIDTPFGRPIVIHDGDLAAECDQLEVEADALGTVLAGALNE